MSGPLICSMPECQTTAGCVCAKRRQPSEHTNCWCDMGVIKCDRYDCPRAQRQYADRTALAAFWKMIAALNAPQP